MEKHADVLPKTWLSVPGAASRRWGSVHSDSGAYSRPRHSASRGCPVPGRLWSSISAPCALVANPSAVVPRNASSHGHLSQGGRTSALEATSVTFRIWCAATFFQTTSVFFIKHTHIQAYAHAHTRIPQKATGQEIQTNRYLGTGATLVRWPGTHVTATRPWHSTFLATCCEDMAQDGFQAGLSRSSSFPGATRLPGARQPLPRDSSLENLTT